MSNKALKNIFLLEISITVIALSAFLYFFGVAMVSGAYIENNHRDLQSLRGELGDLEARYMKQDESLTLDKAYALGLVDAKEAIYLSEAKVAETVSILPK